MDRAALFYPFHLCSRDTLEHLLTRYALVHFRDYMAIQLTPMSGTTAFPDRMSDHCPDLYAKGRIVQGHGVSGPISAETGRRIDRDLADPDWREIFHSALRFDARFRRGWGQERQNENRLASLLGERWVAVPMSLSAIRQLACRTLDPERALIFEYGQMLVRTSAALWYTIQLCQRHTLEAATDVAAYDRLLKRMLIRDRIELRTYLWRTESL